MPPYFFAAERPKTWSSSFMVPPTAHSELWQFVNVYERGNCFKPEALAVWIMPTYVISCEARASNFILRFSSSPLLCAESIL